MYIYVNYNKITKYTINELKKLNLFKNIEHIEGNTLKCETKKQIYKNNKEKAKKIEKKISGINGIKKISSNMEFKQKQNEQRKHSQIYYLFFDIDSTLTRKGHKTINNNVYTIFQKFLARNCVLCFCSGRSRSDINKLRKLYCTGDYGIAENGGILIGVDPEDKIFGNRDEPDRMIKYLQKENFRFEIDQKQTGRTTEYVILKTSINYDIYNIAKKYDVECHESNNTYHISAKDKNKGSAIEYLASIEYLNINFDISKTVGMGDSGLDIPMFEFCDEGYLVGGSTQKVKEQIKKKNLKNVKMLKNKAPKAIEELFNKLFPY